MTLMHIKLHLENSGIMGPSCLFPRIALRIVIISSGYNNFTFVGTKNAELDLKHHGRKT